MSDENKRIDDDWKRRAQEEKQKIATQMGGILEESTEPGEKKTIESEVEKMEETDEKKMEKVNCNATIDNRDNKI